MKKTIGEVKCWLLDNRVDEDGNLILTGLDFSNFDGDVYIDNMKVKKDLRQCKQEVGGSIFQNHQVAKGYLFQKKQNVGESLFQGESKVYGNYESKASEVAGEITEERSVGMRFKKITRDELEKMGYILTD